MDHLDVGIYEKRGPDPKLARVSNSCKLFIGVDEAGYGPNLGPLVIGGSAWTTAAGWTEQGLMEQLTPGFRTAKWKPGCAHVPLGDSKKLYSPSGGLQSIEAGVLAMWTLLDDLPGNLQQLLSRLDREHHLLTGAAPWYGSLSEFSLPHSHLTVGELHRLAEIAHCQLGQKDIEVVSMQSSILAESEFNRRVDQRDSKGQVLSLATLELVTRLLAASPDSPAEIFCDRQGGRTNYLPLLAEWMPDNWFVELQRSAQRCSYRSTIGRELIIHFTVGGDSFTPTALASMVAKYMRECLMASFNSFWDGKVPGIKPTAGYPVDAVRFRQQIEFAAQQLSLPPQLWWRNR